MLQVCFAAIWLHIKNPPCPPSPPRHTPPHRGLTGPWQAPASQSCPFTVALGRVISFSRLSIRMCPAFYMPSNSIVVPSRPLKVNKLILVLQLSHLPSSPGISEFWPSGAAGIWSVGFASGLEYTLKAREPGLQLFLLGLQNLAKS